VTIHHDQECYLRTEAGHVCTCDDEQPDLSAAARSVLSTYVAGPQGDAVTTEDRYASLDDDVDREASEIIAGTEVKRPHAGRKSLVEEIPQVFGKLPLPVRMRLAADVLEQTTTRYHGTGAESSHVDWRPVNLRYVADDWERADAREAERDRAVEELAQTLGTLLDDEISTNAIARTLIDAGWTKS